MEMIMTRHAGARDATTKKMIGARHTGVRGTTTMTKMLGTKSIGSGANYARESAN